MRALESSPSLLSHTIKALSLLLAVAATISLVACSPGKEPSKPSKPSTEQTSAQSGKISTEPFGTLKDGRKATLYVLTNAHGLKAKVTDFGATLVSLEVPCKSGKLADVTHGYDSVAGYDGKANPYFGASVGRFGNRIAHGKFTLAGKAYALATNNAPGGIPCHLHGGKVGFNKVLWTAQPEASKNAVVFTYVSKDGEEGYPGTMTTTVTYTLTDKDELIWEATATTDAETVVNLVHHSYWNLSGDPTTSINDHILTLNADHYLPTDAGLIPTGELAPVADTPMDFTKPTLIGKRVNNDFEALKLGGGYDHCWVLNRKPEDNMILAARLKDPKTGRVMEITTNQPAIQFYGGNFLSPGDFSGEKVPGKGKVAYPHRSALCLETENYPDAPNKPKFPSCVLKPGETYTHKMVHRFFVE